MSAISNTIQCEMCKYEGELLTYKPSMSVYSDCYCPECGSTKNQHNRDYLINIQNGMKACKHTVPQPRQVWVRYPKDKQRVAIVIHKVTATQIAYRETCSVDERVMDIAYLNMAEESGSMVCVYS